LGGQDDHKPVTSLQRNSDFIVPLLGTVDMLFAEERFDVMGT